MEKTIDCFKKPWKMITVSDLQQLITKWQEGLEQASQPFSYRIGVSDCIYDLNQLINHSIEEELDYQDMLQSWEADDYLSSMEAHEDVA